MAETQASCPECGERLAYSADLAGTEALCPCCNASILLPKPKFPAVGIIVAFISLAAIGLVVVLVPGYLANSAVAPRSAAKAGIDSVTTVEKEAFTPQQFISAAQSGNLPMVKLLLQSGIDANVCDTNGSTALMEASWAGMTNVVSFLLENGANVNAKNNYGDTAFSSAIYNENTNIAMLLLGRGADVNNQDTNGDTALIIAAKQSHEIAIDFLLRNSPDVNATNCYGETALDCAAWAGLTNAVQALLSHGANINADDKTEESPLNNAALALHKDVAQILLDNGANPNADPWDSPLSYVAGSTNPAAVPIARLLLNHGADPNAYSSLGGTPLTDAVFAGNIDMVKVLLAYGANVTSVTEPQYERGGISALAWSEMHGDKTIVQLLRAAGAVDSSAPATSLEGLPSTGTGTSTVSSSWFELIDASYRITEKNDQWWAYSFQFRLKNTLSYPVEVIVDVKFLDKDGYVLTDDPLGIKAIPAYSSVLLRDRFLVDLPLASEVNSSEISASPVQ